MLRATHKKEAEGIFSAAGRPWKLQKVVSHFVGKPHYEALSASRAHDLKLHLALHPEENVNNYTQNVLERACAERKQTIYETRIKHVGMVYTDMKCLTLSSNSFPARDLVDSYCDHLLELKDDDFKPFIPTRALISHINVYLTTKLPSTTSWSAWFVRPATAPRSILVLRLGLMSQSEQTSSKILTFLS
eukprot:636557_1